MSSFLAIPVQSDVAFKSVFDMKPLIRVGRVYCTQPSCGRQYGVEEQILIDLLPQAIIFSTPEVSCRQHHNMQSV